MLGNSVWAKIKVIPLSFILLLLLGSPAWGEEWINEKNIDHVIVYVDSPEAIHEQQRDTYHFKFFSAHKVFVGNKKKIKKFKSIVTKILKYSEPEKNYHSFQSDIFLSIVFYDSDRNYRRLFLTNKREFSFRDKYGEIPEYLYKEIVEECEELVNIIDLNFQESILFNSKTRGLCVPNDLSSCN